MRALIAEDEKVLADDLQRRLQRIWPELEIIGVANDGIAARQALQAHKPDVAFLDIQMPGITGLEAAQCADKQCRIVFVTAYDQYAVAAFEQAAADYLLKPVSDERLQRCVERLRSSELPDQEKLLEKLSGLLQQNGKPAPLRWIRAQLGQDVHMLPVEDVCYFQSDDKYTTVLTRDKEYLVRTPLKELLEQLDPLEFWQVHRSTLVNVRQIVSAQHDEAGKVLLNLRDRKEQVAVSRSYAHLFRQM